MAQRVWLGALMASVLVAGVATAAGPAADTHVTQLPETYVAGGRVIGRHSRIESAVPAGGAARSRAEGPRVSAELSHDGLREEAGRSTGGGVVVDMRGRFGSALRLEGPRATCESASVVGVER